MDKLKSPDTLPDTDPTAESRKKDHIELAFQSRVQAGELDGRFDYEPMLAAHPAPGSWPSQLFGGKTLRTPIWVSSMTGGTELARTINRNLARACAEFGMGMGLGSCRQLLYSSEHLADFNVRDTMGADMPLFTNLGVAQIEKLIDDGELGRIVDMIALLRADGLIIHVNPLQEAMQPEGDVFQRAPIETIQTVLEQLDVPLIVKEVGQGFGPASMRALLQLPLLAVEFAAAGGTNFAKLELLRSDIVRQQIFEKIATVGHTAADMLTFANEISLELGDSCRVQNLILSGGVRDFLDGYYLLSFAHLPSVYGQASGLLAHARGDYADLQAFLQAQVRGLELARAFLQVKYGNLR